MTVGSDRVGDQIGRSRPLCGESVVVLTTLVDPKWTAFEPSRVILRLGEEIEKPR